jgi:hypothetical protein
VLSGTAVVLSGGDGVVTVSEAHALPVRAVGAGARGPDSARPTVRGTAGVAGQGWASDGGAETFHDHIPGWDPPPEHDADTVQLAVTDPVSDPVPDPSGSGEPPRHGRRSERSQPRRKVPWFWIAGGLIVLALVGRGLIGAGFGQGGAPSPITPTPSPSGSVDFAGPPDASTTSGPAPTATAVPTVPPTVPPTEGRVTLPLAPPKAPTPSPTHAALHCSVTVSTSMFWGGYNATLTVKNTGQAHVDGWRLVFTLPQGQHLASGWNATFITGQRGSVRASDAGYNAKVPPGGSVQIGFQAQFGVPGSPGVPGAPGGSGSLGGPGRFALNGVACS